MSGILWKKRNFVFFLCFLVITAKTTQAVGTVYFADPYLKAVVEEKLGISEPNATDMLALTELDAGGKGIIYLKGIEYASNLTKLSLAGNWISDISPVSGLTKLTRLRLDENRISDVSPLSGLTKLTMLRLDENRINDISLLSGLTNLKKLRLDENRISYVSPLSGLTNLTELGLNNTHTRDVSVISGLKKLTNLSLFNNEISDIQAISNLTNLKELNLHYNQIRDISAISGLTKLTRLRLDGNRISDISPLSGLTKLTRLCLDGNRISDISPITGLRNLRELDLNNNQLSDVSAISGLKNLTNLCLFNNQISDISAVSNLTNLTALYLHNNRISDISAISELTNLTVLYLRYNQIGDISAVSGLKNLTELSLSHNQIGDISAISGLTNLTELYLSHNQIGDISAVSGLKNLTRLWLSYNQIGDISAVSNLTNLKGLYLHYNQIMDVSAVSGLKNLVWLELNYNKHNDVSFGSGLTNLSFIEALDKNAELLRDPNIDNVKTRAQGDLGGLIAQNITEHLVYIINECGGFEELKNILNRKLQDYPEHPKGKYYSNNGLGAYFIIYDNVIAYFFSICDRAGYLPRYTNIGFLPLISQIEDALLPEAPDHFYADVYSPPVVDIFEVDDFVYLLEAESLPGNGHFSSFTLSTIKNGEIRELESHSMVGDIVSYDFDKKILLTKEYKDCIKQESSHPYRAVYNMTYRIGRNIEVINEKCLNPWYLVVKKYIEAVWEKDIEKAKHSVLDEEVLERTRNFRYCDPNIPIQLVEDLNLDGENIKEEIKTVYLDYEYMGKKKWVSAFEALDLKEYDGEWKIIDIRDRQEVQIDAKSEDFAS